MFAGKPKIIEKISSPSKGIKSVMNWSVIMLNVYIAKIRNHCISIAVVFSINAKKGFSILEMIHIRMKVLD